MKKLFLLGLLMIMSVCYIFGQGEALDAKKGLAYMLSGKTILEFHIVKL